MIFLTIGTHEPFDRLIRAVDEWCDQTEKPYTIFAQIVSPQSDAYKPRNFRTVARLSPEDYDARFAEANLVVSHAGMGTILTALMLGKPIVVMPRRGHLRETRNDHQQATASRLGNRPGLFVASDETTLAQTMDQALAAHGHGTTPSIPTVADSTFTDALRAFLLSPRENQR